MALGARYARGELNFMAYSFLNVIYAAIAPISIFIGLAITKATPQVLEAILGISAGTFLCAGSFENPAGKLEENKAFPVLEFVIFAVAAIVMFIITVIITATGVH